jgi:hypothetical protein
MTTQFRVFKKNNGNKLNGTWKHHRRPAMMHSFIVLHPLQLPVGRDLFGPHITKGITWNNRLKQD